MTCPSIASIDYVLCRETLKLHYQPCLRNLAVDEPSNDQSQHHLKLACSSRCWQLHRNSVTEVYNHKRIEQHTLIWPALRHDGPLSSLPDNPEGINCWFRSNCTLLSVGFGASIDTPDSLQTTRSADFGPDLRSIFSVHVMPFSAAARNL